MDGFGLSRVHHLHHVFFSGGTWDGWLLTRARLSWLFSSCTTFVSSLHIDLCMGRFSWSAQYLDWRLARATGRLAGLCLGVTLEQVNGSVGSGLNWAGFGIGKDKFVAVFTYTHDEIRKCG